MFRVTQIIFIVTGLYRLSLGVGFADTALCIQSFRHNGYNTKISTAYCQCIATKMNTLRAHMRKTNPPNTAATQAMLAKKTASIAAQCQNKALKPSP